MNGSATSNPATRRPELDGLRAIAILLVLFSHHLAGVPIAGLRRFIEMGWVGVDLFFVLSGFLIGGILLDQQTAANYYRVFYLRRFFRIVPLYALILVPGLIVLGLGLQTHFSGHSLASQTSGGIWFYPFFLQNIGTALAFGSPAYLAPAWSLAVEEQFYLLLPPVIHKLAPKKLPTFLVLAILAAPLLRGVLLWAFGKPAGLACYVLLPCRWDSLLLGVIVACAYRQAGMREWLARRLNWCQWFWCLSAAGSVVLLDCTAGRLDPPMAFLGYTLIDMFFACTLLLAVINPHGRLQYFLSRPSFGPVATISYGLYLIQSPMKAIVESVFRFAHIHYDQTGWAATGVALLSLAATFAAATVSWKLFESRLIRLGHQFRYSKPAGD